MSSATVNAASASSSKTSLPVDYFELFLDTPKQFVKDSIQLINRCKKPDRKEFLKISQAVGMGFLVMGFIGFIVKLIHIPINNIIVGGGVV